MRIPRRHALLTMLGLGLVVALASSGRAEPFRTCGFYINLTRLPTFGLKAWKETVDCVKQDGGNLLILWIGGGFRSAKYPITWRFNAEHENIRHDFGKALIDHAHRRGIRVILGFTPFGYDGVNQYYQEHPELVATGPNGKPTPKFGIYSWGYNLCPSQAESQQFMLEYARELLTFYPNADGLFIESSDYAVCHCALCGDRYFEKEFQFVRTISDWVWSKKPKALVAVYPHYFSGSKVPFADARGAKLSFDPRWTLIFTPHSAPVEPGLTKRAAGSIYSDEGVAWCSIDRVREGAKRANAAGCNGYVPSAECFSYIPSQPEWGEPWIVGKRVVPFGFGWLKTGECPYRELPIRAARFAYREYTKNPDLSDADFRKKLGVELFGSAAAPQKIDDALFLTSIFNLDRNWSVPPPVTSPDLVQARKDQGRIDAARLALYQEKLEQIRLIAARYPAAGQRGEKELGAISRWILSQWSKSALLAHPLSSNSGNSYHTAAVLP